MMECDKNEYAFIQKMSKECGPAWDGKISERRGV